MDPVGRNSRLIPIVAALVVVGSLRLLALGGPDAAAADAYHDRVLEAVRSIPPDLDSWRGKETDVPASARALLRPNALLGRQYRDVRTGRAASLVVVQCRDTRDMSGHYPPRCYPAHGWIQEETGVPHEVVVDGRTFRVTRYEFTRREFDRVRRIAIDNFFVLPGRGVVRDMGGVLEAAADYRLRPFGAGQVQILTDGTLPAGDRDQIFRELIAPVIPLIEAMAELPAGGDG